MQRNDACDIVRIEAKLELELTAGIERNGHSWIVHEHCSARRPMHSSAFDPANICVGRNFLLYSNTWKQDQGELIPRGGKTSCTLDQESSKTATQSDHRGSLNMRG
jgi:hypothetical protein